jgi:diaminohydroxyphosphoribosylaminopyrimidine deaminase/5-amino-6-(5-phosphoribosylamino)uracil reductase
MPEPTWISNELSRMLVHKWRAEEEAILVGTHTAIKDNPQLNLREWTGKQPLRMVIDRNLTLPENLQIFNPPSPVTIFNQVKEGTQGNIRYVLLPFERLLPSMMHFLYHEGIQSVIVEGGLKTLDGFIRENLWDEARVFTGQRLFGQGVPAPEIKGIEPISSFIREDLIRFFYNDGRTD